MRALLCAAALIFGEPILVHAVAIDVHLHAFSGKSWGKRVTGPDIIRELDAAGIDRGIVISAGYFGGFRSLVFGRSRKKVELENDYIAELVKAHPSRLAGACGVHPFDEWAEAELLRCAKELDFRAVKVHPNAQRIDIMDEEQRSKLQGFLARAGQLNMVVLMHAYGKPLEFNKELYRMAATMPETAFVFLHAFGSDLTAMVREVSQGRLPKPANIFIDISGTVQEAKGQKALASAIRELGVDRILFGSDFPVFKPAAGLEVLRKLPLTPREIERILSNAGPFSVRRISGASWKAFSDRMTDLFRAGKYAEAAQVGENAVKAAEDSLGGNDLNVAGALERLAMSYFAQGKFAEATPVARRALLIYESKVGKNAREIVDPAKILGAIYLMQGDLDQAEPLLERAVRMSRKFFGKRHVETAKQLGNLGALYMARKKPAKARRHFEEALAIWGDKPDAVYGAMTMVNLGKIRADDGDLDGADALFRKALALREQAFGREHPQTKNIADSYAQFQQKGGLAP